MFNSVIVTVDNIKFEAPNLKVNLNDNGDIKCDLFLYINLIPNTFDEEHLASPNILRHLIVLIKYFIPFPNKDFHSNR